MLWVLGDEVLYLCVFKIAAPDKVWKVSESTFANHEVSAIFPPFCERENEAIRHPLF